MAAKAKATQEAAAAAEDAAQCFKHQRLFFNFDQLETADLFDENASSWSLMPESCSYPVPDDDEAIKGSLFVQDVVLQDCSTIRIQELPLADGVHASTGCQLWPASIALAHLLLSRPSLIMGKSVIELGAGCGFAGIVAARLAERAVVTDADTETVKNLRHNVLMNADYWLKDRPSKRPPIDVSAERLAWEDVVRNGWPPERRADVVIGSDIIYGNWGQTVVKVAEHLLYPSGTMIMLSAEDRGGLPEFERSMVSAGFEVELSHWYDADKRFLLYICGPGNASITRQSGACGALY